MSREEPTDVKRPTRIIDLFPDFGPKGAEPPQAFKFCNLVLQGGGMHGAALTGFVERLEQDGIRFAGIAGASAGAIVAMGMVGGRKSVFEACGPQLVELVKTMPAPGFVDGPREIRALVKRLMRGEGFLKLKNALPSLKGWQRIKKRRGLNPGLRFESWLDQELAEKFELASINDLQARLEKHHGEFRGQEELSKWVGLPGKPDEMLKLMASGLPVGLKFEFPQDLNVINLDWAKTSPARLVRASMAVPFFFEPVRFELRAGPWEDKLKQYTEHLQHETVLNEASKYERITLVDGGVFSNLPLYAFEGETGSTNNAINPARQRLPTIVVTLLHHDPDRADRTPGPRYRQSASAVFQEIGDTLAAIKGQRDRDAYVSMVRPQERRDMVLWSIDLSGHDWLDFFSPIEEILKMHQKGYDSAGEMLRYLKEPH